MRNSSTLTLGKAPAHAALGRADTGPAPTAPEDIVTRIRLAGLISLVLAVMALPGCSSAGGEGAVFADSAPSSDGGSATTVDVVDVVLPGLTNVSGSSVKLRGVSLVSVPQAVHLRSVTVYGTDMKLALGRGDLLRYCRATDKPYPLSADVTPPHSDSPWNVMLAITFAKPGSYHLVRAKIFYTADGHSGWQYQMLDTTMTVTAASKGSRSALDGC
jgi:hypothetical protein